MTKLRWRYGIVAGIFLAIFATYPQMKMWYAQGDSWNGHYAYNDIDEVAYAGYLKALIDGRPRKNDPYTGRDDSESSPQPESLFSIQFAAPYTIAMPARILGISAPTAMTIAGALFGFLAALGCFWIIGLIVDDSLFAMMGALVVLCGGALAAGEGAIGEILGTGFAYPYFPFLRRYVPAVPFPVFFVFITSIWLLLRSESRNRQYIFGMIAFVSFTFLVFSYFYIWTTAAAWVVCLTILWLIFRSEDRLSGFLRLFSLGVACLFPLAAYAYLLASRAKSMDNVQLLVETHQPDLFRFPEYISFAVIFLLGVGGITRAISFKSRKIIFVLSLALVPIIVFNQQVITGQSLQPIHYQVFIGNYVAALSLVVAVGLFWGKITQKRERLANLLAIVISLTAVVWGFVECHYTVRVLDQANIIRDNGMPLARRLRDLESGNPNPHSATIFSLGNLQSDDSPTVAPQNVLWSRHQHVFAGLSWQESKERYYQYLYYQNLDEEWLETRLKNRDFVSMISLFGWGRHSNRLSKKAKPLSLREIKDEVQRYKRFIENFTREQAEKPRLSYLVIPKDWNPNLQNLEKWYERDAGETVGIYRLYKLKIK